MVCQSIGRGSRVPINPARTRWSSSLTFRGVRQQPSTPRGNQRHGTVRIALAFSSARPRGQVAGTAGLSSWRDQALPAVASAAAVVMAGAVRLPVSRIRPAVRAYGAAYRAHERGGAIGRASSLSRSCRARGPCARCAVGRERISDRVAVEWHAPPLQRAAMQSGDTANSHARLAVSGRARFLDIAAERAGQRRAGRRFFCCC